jgi:hypothetical protein
MSWQRLEFWNVSEGKIGTGILGIGILVYWGKKSHPITNN